MTVGLLVGDVENSFYSVIAKHVEAVTKDAGYHVVLCNSDDDPKVEREYLKLLEGMRVDALIVTPTSKNRRHLASLMDKDIVIVQVDRRVEGLDADAVLVDNEAGAVSAVSHLIEAGHTRIGILTGELEVPTANQRLAGYERTLREHGITRLDVADQVRLVPPRARHRGRDGSHPRATDPHRHLRREQHPGRGGADRARAAGPPRPAGRVDRRVRRRAVDEHGGPPHHHRAPADRRHGQERGRAHAAPAPRRARGSFEHRRLRDGAHRARLGQLGPSREDRASIVGSVTRERLPDDRGAGGCDLGSMGHARRAHARRSATKDCSARTTTSRSLIRMSEGRSTRGRRSPRSGRSPNGSGSVRWSPRSRSVTRPSWRSRSSPRTTRLAGGWSWAWGRAGSSASIERSGSRSRAIRERVDILTEQVEIVHRLWGGEGAQVDFEGEHYRLEACPALPAPYQDPHPPLIIGGDAGPRSVALAARWADEYDFVHVNPADAEERGRRVSAACDAIGRDPAEPAPVAADEDGRRGRRGRRAPARGRADGLAGRGRRRRGVPRRSPRHTTSPGPSTRCSSAWRCSRRRASSASSSISGCTPISSRSS